MTYSIRSYAELSHEANTLMSLAHDLNTVQAYMNACDAHTDALDAATDADSRRFHRDCAGVCATTASRIRQRQN